MKTRRQFRKEKKKARNKAKQERRAQHYQKTKEYKRKILPMDHIRKRMRDQLCKGMWKEHYTWMAQFCAKNPELLGIEAPPGEATPMIEEGRSTAGRQSGALVPASTSAPVQLYEPLLPKPEDLKPLRRKRRKFEMQVCRTRHLRQCKQHYDEDDGEVSRGSGEWASTTDGSGSSGDESDPEEHVDQDLATVGRLEDYLSKKALRRHKAAAVDIDEGQDEEDADEEDSEDGEDEDVAEMEEQEPHPARRGRGSGRHGGRGRGRGGGRRMQRR
eukprot:RCo005084